MQGKSLYKLALLLPMLALTACASQPERVPVAVVCPPFPTPPAQLMIAPAISDYLKYYDTLKASPTR